MKDPKERSFGSFILSADADRAAWLIPRLSLAGGCKTRQAA